VSTRRTGCQEACTKCGAKPGEPCRTLATGKTTDAHKARWLPIVTRRAAAIRAESPDEDPYHLTPP
jgi:hypothetical protein